MVFDFSDSGERVDFAEQQLEQWMRDVHEGWAAQMQRIPTRDLRLCLTPLNDLRAPILPPLRDMRAAAKAGIV